MRRPKPTTTAAAVLLAWYALNFIGVPGLVQAESLRSPAGVMLALLLVLVLGSARGWPGSAPCFAVAMLGWLALQLGTHWWTYLFADPDPSRLAWYTRQWGGLIRVLPARSGRTVPDLCHTVLFILLLATLVAALRDGLRRPRDPVRASGP